MTTNILILFLGGLFGAILKYANLNKFDVISAQSHFKDNTVLKTIILTIGLGSIILSVLVGLGFASFHIKPFFLGGIIFGGLIFGSGMAILGYCPGTLVISFGEGSIDALVGIVGGLTAGLVFTYLFPSMQFVLGDNLGKISLLSLTGDHKVLYFILVFIIGVALIYSAFYINKKEKSLNRKWIVSGVSLAILNAIVFLKLTTNRPIGASTSFPYISDSIFNFTENDYFSKIKTPGHWEMIFLLGAFLSALIISLLKKEFKFILLHKEWRKYKGSSVTKRIIWSFIGGFILIIGARMAGGCTSGHIISGGMQLAISSLVFAVFVFIGLSITGKLFYKNNQ